MARRASVSAPATLSPEQAYREAKADLLRLSSTESVHGTSVRIDGVKEEVAKALLVLPEDYVVQLVYDVIYASHHNRLALMVIAQVLAQSNPNLLASVFVQAVKTLGDQSSKSFKARQEFD